jgi:hypothetical protein
VPGGQRSSLNGDTLPMPAYLAANDSSNAAGERRSLNYIGQSSWRRRAAWIAGFTLSAVVLFLCCLRLSRTAVVTSDDSSNALQAWDMLHGNLLLHGWALSDVSFYTTELPKYLLAEAVLGLGPGVVHVVAAATYTLLVLLAALLAKGRATGREGITRMLLAGGIMLVPQPGNGLYTLMMSPDHIGAGVPLLLTWLLIDRARPRWYVPVATFSLLTATLIGDPLTLLLAVAPLTLACVVRLCARLLRRGQRLAPAWYETSLAIAAIASVTAASFVTRLIRAHGGWTVSPVNTGLAKGGMLPGNLKLTFEGLLELFGANVFAHPATRDGLFTALAAVHLAGAALVAWACWLALRRFFRGEDLVTAVLVAAIILNVAAYASGRYVVTILDTREIAVVLPFGAVLAGRLLAGRLLAARLGPAMAAMGVGYLVIAAVYLVQPTVPAANSALTGWLSRHHLSQGLAGYWQANSVTLDSAGAIDVRPVERTVAVRPWETKLSSLAPHSNYANFVISAPGGIPRAAAVATFGRPARVYRFGKYTIMVWNRNLLSRLCYAPDVPGSVPRCPSASPTNITNGK